MSVGDEATLGDVFKTQQFKVKIIAMYGPIDQPRICVYVRVCVHVHDRDGYDRSGSMSDWKMIYVSVLAFLGL